MALPAPLTPVQLTALNHEELFDYFAINARFIGDAPEASRCKYGIRFGSRTIYSDDTRDLRIKFNHAVGVERHRLQRSYRKAKK